MYAQNQPTKPTPNPDQVLHQLQQDLTYSCLHSWLTGVTERSLPSHAIFNVYRSKYPQFLKINPSKHLSISSIYFIVCLKAKSYIVRLQLSYNCQVIYNLTSKNFSETKILWTNGVTILPYSNLYFSVSKWLALICFLLNADLICRLFIFHIFSILVLKAMKIYL